METRYSPILSGGHLIMFLLLFLLILFYLPKTHALSHSSSSSSKGTTIHDLLRENGLPGGLLPKSVKFFNLNNETGLLEVYLDKPCYAKYESLAYFDQVVKGNLSYGELKGVVGLSQEELFLWLPVKGILISDPSSGVILFDIGMAQKQLSRSLFEEPPDCRPVGLKDRQVIRSGEEDGKSRFLFGFSLEMKLSLLQFGSSLLLVCRLENDTREDRERIPTTEMRRKKLKEEDEILWWFYFSKASDDRR